jgi:cytochrome c biogenesis protein
MKGQFAPWLKQLLLMIQAYDVYHAFWFDFLLAMLFVNLAVCTYLRFPATWRRYAMVQPPMPSVKAAQEVVPVAAAPSPVALDVLRKRGYVVSELADGAYFAEKNKFVRLNPTFIHISLFLIIGGAIVGGLTGLKNSFPIQVGQTVSSQQVVDESYLKGKLHGAPRPFDLRLDAFRMDFRPSGQVKQYYSEVTITPKDGGVPYQQTLWVNEPLVVDGMYFYQSFWGVGGLTYTVDGKPADLALTQAKIGGYMSKPFKAGNEEYMFFLRSANEPCLIVSTKSFNPVAELTPGMTKPLAGHEVGIKEYRFFSGLETKRDPGIPLVYLGCGILIFGLVMVPFSHRELWVRPGEEGWLLAGRTHKGRVMLRKEMEEIAGVWPA